MEKLLDKEVHQMYKAPASSVYYSSPANSQQSNGSSYLSVDEKISNEEGAPSKETEDGEAHEDSENGNSSNDVPKDVDHPSSATRPRSLPSAQNSGSSSSRMRDLRQSHRLAMKHLYNLKIFHLFLFLYFYSHISIFMLKKLFFLLLRGEPLKFRQKNTLKVIISLIL